MLFIPALCHAAQQDSPAPAVPGASARVVSAVRLNGETPRIDGRLDEPAWSRAQPATALVQREPSEGAPAPDQTEVWFLYTEADLYIGARMRQSDPTMLKSIVARRDRETPSEQLIISLDTRQDRRTAYTFAVTSAGVRTDYFHPGDSETFRDYSFDPVWEVATETTGDGWTAEIRIPFTQLRFNPGDRQTWGLNLVRNVPGRNEAAYWSLVRRNETGWASRMGQLAGIQGIRPSRRIELSPYLAGNATRRGAVDPSNPFDDQYQGRMRAGADLKMGLGPNFTLDATFNPDFGQVEADPAEVNLTAFETFFSERRPFFVEGSDLFGNRGTFYSRRIGSRPVGAPGAPYAEPIENSAILGAAKLTGRLPSGLALGALSAVTAEERVATFDPASNAFGTATVAPLTGFGVVTARQEFGRDRSTVSGTLTAVERDLGAGSPLSAVLARQAYTGVADLRIRWGGGGYDMSAYAGFSHVQGDPLAILGLQRSSRRYFQRPDADHVELDPGRTALTGLIAGINHSKMAGNWLWDIDLVLESPAFEPNDAGSLGAADDQAVIADLIYRQTKPGRLFHNWSAGAFQYTEWNLGGVRTATHLGWFSSLTFRNFWRGRAQAVLITPALSDNLTRGGPLMATPRSWGVDLELANQRGARTGLGIAASGRWDELDGWYNELEASVSLRPTSRWEVALDSRYTRSVTARQYVTSRPGGTAATFGTRYLFGYVDRSEIAEQLRMSFAVQPDLTVEAYLEPFASSGRYRDLGELAAARTSDLRTYGTDGTTLARDAAGTYTVTDGTQSFTFSDPDFDVRSLRSNVVLRW
ncbi:MAG TPA: DUF5916 domain-containing protein, partial [Gemmatimonadales bacterium]|nr:DUF5916 domain-containing protein [Gemmatimonadales bacterium]